MFAPKELSQVHAAAFASKHKVLKPDVDFIVKRGPELSKKINTILIKR